MILYRRNYLYLLNKYKTIYYTLCTFKRNVVIDVQKLIF